MDESWGAVHTVVEVRLEDVLGVARIGRDEDDGARGPLWQREPEQEVAARFFAHFDPPVQDHGVLALAAIKRKQEVEVSKDREPLSWR